MTTQLPFNREYWPSHVASYVRFHLRFHGFHDVSISHKRSRRSKEDTIKHSMDSNSSCTDM